MKETKYVIGIIGSPRKNGNTSVTIHNILRIASLKGAKTEKIFLNQLKIKFCQGCDYCKSHKNCKTKDDFQKVIKKIENSTGVIIGSPIYFGTLSAQTKAFIDRLYSLFDKNFKNKLKGKRKGAFVLVWAATDKTYARKRKPTVDLLESVLKSPLNAKIIGKIAKGGIGSIGDARKDKEIMKAARRIGNKIV
ncbi:MAG: flavodoxin family protein [candidate division WOR-3 bacterium]